MGRLVWRWQDGQLLFSRGRAYSLRSIWNCARWGKLRVGRGRCGRWKAVGSRTPAQAPVSVIRGRKIQTGDLSNES